jgi:flagellar hook-length control protein FliK
VSIPLTATSTGPVPASSAFPGAPRAGADRSGAGRGGDFASLLGAVGERPDASGQERLDRSAPQQRSARPSQERDQDERAARHDAAERRDRAKDHRDHAADRRDGATDRRDDTRRHAAERRRDDAVAGSERAALRRHGAEQPQSGEGGASPAAAAEHELEATGGTTGGDCVATTPETSPAADSVVEPVAQSATSQVPSVPVLSGAAGAALLQPMSELAAQSGQAVRGDAVAGLVTATGDTTVGTGQTGLAAIDADLAGVPASVPAGISLDTGTQIGGPQSVAAPAPAAEGGADTRTLDVTFLDATGPIPGATSPAEGPSGSPDQPAQATGPAGLLDEAATVDPAPPAPATDDPAVTPLPGPAASGTRPEPAAAPLGLPERTSAAEPASAADALLRTNIGATVADLARAAHRDGSGATRVVIRLDPPELGTVTVALTVRGGEVRVNLLASDVAAVAALDARRTDIDHALAGSGLSLDSFDVQSDSRQGQEQQHHGRERASSAGRPWRALGPEMDWERAAAVDRAARGVWL